MQYKCPNCLNIIQEGNNFCKYCGQKLNWPKNENAETIKCSRCTFEYNKTFNFCPNCGMPDLYKHRFPGNAHKEEVSPVEELTGEIAFSLDMLTTSSVFGITPEDIQEKSEELNDYYEKIKSFTFEEQKVLCKNLIICSVNSLFDAFDNIREKYNEDYRDAMIGDSIFTPEEVFNEYFFGADGLCFLINEQRNYIKGLGLINDLQEEYWHLNEIFCFISATYILAASNYPNASQQYIDAFKEGKLYNKDFEISGFSEELYPKFILERGYFKENLKDFRNRTKGL